MLAGDSGPGGIRFDDVRSTYLVGSVALALILFDGGLRTRFESIRAVLAPSMVLATVGVLLTALITAPVAKYTLGMNWTEALLLGAVVASTDAAAVFLLVHRGPAPAPPRRRDARSRIRHQRSVRDLPHADAGGSSFRSAKARLSTLRWSSSRETGLGTVDRRDRRPPRGARRSTTWRCRRACMRRSLTTAALVIFGAAQIVHGSGFLAVYLAGIIIGNRPTRAHNSVVDFPRRRDLAGADRDVRAAWPAGFAEPADRQLRAGGDRGGALMFVARPVAVFLCLAPFPFQRREKIFIAWTGLRGAVAIFLASIPMLVGSAEGLSLFRRRLRRRDHLAVAAGLDAGAGRAAAARRTAARRPRPAARRTRSARPARAAAGRLSRALEKPVFSPRADSILVETDAGHPRPADFHAGGGRADRGRRLHLSAGAAGKGRSAGSLLRRHGAELCARSASARRLHGVRRTSRSANLAEIYGVQGRRGAGQTDAGGLFRHPSRPRAEGSAPNLPLDRIVLVVRSASAADASTSSACACRRTRSTGPPKRATAQAQGAFRCGSVRRIAMVVSDQRSGDWDVLAFAGTTSEGSASPAPSPRPVRSLAVPAASRSGSRAGAPRRRSWLT